LLLAAADAFAQRWHAVLGAATDEVWRGVSQTRGHAAAQAGFSISGSSGWYAGAWTSIPLEQPSAEPRLTADFELDLFAGYRRMLGDLWSLDTTLVRYSYPGDGRALEYNHTELMITLDYAGRVSATAAVSPDTSLYTARGPASDRTAIAWELAFVHPLVRGLSLTGGAGYYDVSDLFATGYVYWNAGFSWEADRIAVDLTYIATDAKGRMLFETRADPRTVVSLLVTF
jgi:uncharacterized protein (TIGR02001 family)